VKVPGRRSSVLRPAAANEYSIARVARFALPSASAAARYGPAAALVVAALLLIVAEFLTVREIRVLTVVPPEGTATGGSHHGYALAVVALATLPMTYGATVRGARPAAVALLVLALVAWAVILLIDRPLLDDTGIIGRTYELAEARPGPGFYVESVGAALALVGAVAGLLIGPSARPVAPLRRASPRS
jgi:uncharacterized membrane protein